MSRYRAVCAFGRTDPFVVEQVQLPAPGLSRKPSALRFGQISDLHLHALGPQHEQLTRTVNELDLDFLCLTGDFLAAHVSTWRPLHGLLSGFRCRHGIFACRGNWEVKQGVRPSVFREMLASWGVRLLVNESCVVETPWGSVRIGGVDDVRAGWPRFDAAWRNGPPADFNILLSHAPLTARFVRPKDGVDLVLSGHTHGGQVRIPLIWRLLLPHCSGGFVAGLYPMEWGHLYVNRGFGEVGAPPVRFRCPAEFAVFTIGPAGE